MLRCIKIRVYSEFVRIDSMGEDIRLATLLRDQDCQERVLATIGTLRVWIDLSRELCSDRSRVVGGITWNEVDPDPLVYLPIIDFLSAYGKKIARVSIDGVAPFSKLIRAFDVGMAAVVIGVLSVAVILNRTNDNLNLKVADLAAKLQRESANQRHIQTGNQSVLDRVARGIDRIRSLEGHLIQLEFINGQLSIDGVIPYDENTVNSSETIDVLKLTDNWASIHVSNVE